MVNKIGLTTVPIIHDEIVLRNYPCKICLYPANIHDIQKIVPPELIFITELLVREYSLAYYSTYIVA